MTSPENTRPATEAARQRVCIVGISGKLGQYLTAHALERGYEVVGVCRPQSVAKLDHFGDRITVIPGETSDRSVIERAVAGCTAVLTVLAPWGVRDYSSRTAQAVMDFAPAGARLIFSCGWHVRASAADVYSRRFLATVAIASWLAKAVRAVDIADQTRAAEQIFASDTRWTLVRGSDLEEGESEGLPAWSPAVGSPLLESNLTRRTDFALFMVEAITNDALIGQAPAIVGCRSESALAYASAARA
ncbi:NAD(P)-dependent oxidoreductase [Salinibacterium sp. NK8237]|uniref:NAD(P)-dependent oxidoreductase n=1 Tax=Salinibacterium sp. NK8237 TaxID=2792038 RepID=UPI0018CE27F9|nr:NAD(P)H-binding protein [Salinibacterium sp. NK8237]MBH0131281.1 NAD(P)H-binding protein [Salinibacterium sp. NK8237]